METESKKQKGSQNKTLHCFKAVKEQMTPLNQEHKDRMQDFKET